MARNSINREVDRELRRLGYSGINDPRANRTFADKRSELSTANETPNRNRRRNSRRRNNNGNGRGK